MLIDLSLEQQFQLRQLRSEIEDLSRAELIALVLEERRDYLLQGNCLRSVMVEAGMEVEEPMDIFLALPETDEEMIATFGHMPSDEELAAYVGERVEACQEAARIDVDIEAIALGMEEP
jgi:transposase